MLWGNGREFPLADPVAYAGSEPFVLDLLAFAEQPATPVTSAAYHARPN
jgi:hypothetical protein